MSIKNMIFYSPVIVIPGIYPVYLPKETHSSHFNCTSTLVWLFNGLLKNINTEDHHLHNHDHHPK